MDKNKDEIKDEIMDYIMDEVFCLARELGKLQNLEDEQTRVETINRNQNRRAWLKGVAVNEDSDSSEIVKRLMGLQEEIVRAEKTVAMGKKAITDRIRDKIDSLIDSSIEPKGLLQTLFNRGK